ncbi:MAG: putative toxin-antitoxin system toxin component, PIN family [Thaumarchaeota archaeon]|nr:putative toxin-antitoxin system toxin component, PIN family [Nitrososphaerota archaeon]
MLRIVLDTNVLVSALIRNGKPRKLFQTGIDGKYKILISKETLDELSEVIQRPKFKMTGEDIIRIVSALMETCENVRVASNFEVISNDPDDNIIINTAHDGNVDYIVSGDKDIQDLKNFKKIKIVSVDEMLKFF